MKNRNSRGKRVRRRRGYRGYEATERRARPLYTDVEISTNLLEIKLFEHRNRQGDAKLFTGGNEAQFLAQVIGWIHLKPEIGRRSVEANQSQSNQIKVIFFRRWPTRESLLI